MNAPFVRDKPQSGAEHTQAVLHTSFEVDGRGLLKIFGGTRNLANTEAKHDRLGDHLIIEDEVVGILMNWKSFENFTGEGTEARVILREFNPQEKILERGQQAV